MSSQGLRHPARGGALLFVLLALAALLAAPAEAKKFERAPLPVEKKRAFDLGVVDFDQDGILDIFTANHMFRETLLRGTGGRRYEDAFHRMRFSSTPQIPSITSITRRPVRDEPGLYFFLKARRKRPNINIRTNGLQKLGENAKSASGEITLVFPKVKLIRKRNASVRIERVSSRKTRVHFTARNSASIVLRANHVAIPFGFKVDKPYPRRSLFLGARGVQAKKRSYRNIELGDRHGAGWADFNYDGNLDLFFVGGGVSGELKKFAGVVQDELMINQGDRFVDATKGAGLRKGACRGRESLPADVNRDGSLDLLVGCIDGRPRLYESTGRSSFRNASARLKKLGKDGTAYRWVDTDNDRRMELIQARKNFMRIYDLGRSGRAKRKQRILTRNDDADVDALAPGDIDNDGDIDLFVAAQSGNTLMVNRRGRLRPRNPRKFGLPSKRGTAANWVDYNNDGRLDLHTAPNGLYKNRGGRRFKRMGMLRSPKFQRFGRASWFDADNDGRRDLAMVIQRGTRPNPTIQFHRNTTSRRQRWLELDLVGSKLNRQAIGARVTLRAGKRKLTQWVGQNDGSRYGSGHYRLYFGLGRKRAARKVVVRWPEGGKTRFKRIKANRVKTIKR